MKNKIAIIDMGTNTFHLLIAEGDEKGFNIIYRDRLAVKIGMGGINKGLITESGLQRALIAMQSFKNTIDQHNIATVYAFGTSALRNARNGQEVAQKIRSVTGIEINIGQCVDFVQCNVNVVCADACRNNRNPFSSYRAGMRDEFSMLGLDFNAVKIAAHKFYAVRIANNNHSGGKFLWSQIKMINSSPLVNDQFRFLNAAHKRFKKLNERYYL